MCDLCEKTKGDIIVSNKVYFITGVTGDLGSELLAYIAEDKMNEIYCLIRAKDNQSYHERLNGIMAAMGIENQGNIIAVEGDLCTERLGLMEEQYDNLTQRVTHILHCAADVRFNQPIEQMRLVNVAGTDRILQFAKLCQARTPGFCQFSYVGTTYVAGCTNGLVTENDLTDKYGFNNSYEQSKYEAECLVRSEMEKGLPVIIFRPSVILGASGNGMFKKTSVLYPLIILYNKLFPSIVLPISDNVKLDIVSIDYVTKSILYISSDPKNLNQCFQLAAGPGKSIDVDKQFTRIIIEELQIKDVQFLPLFLWKILFPFWKLFNQPLYKRICKLRKMNELGGYRSYVVKKNPQFSIETTEKALKGSKIVVPDPVEFLRACVRYAKLNYL